LLGFVKRSTRNVTNQSACRTFYLTLVRSQVGYAMQVWSPVRRAHLLIRMSTKACFKIHPWPVFSLRSQLRATAEEIEAFSCQLLWHKYLDMMFLFKVSCGAINLLSSVLPTQTLNKICSTKLSPILQEEMLYSDIPTVVYNQINKDLEYFTKTHN
jgi:hypothetical protein